MRTISLKPTRGLLPFLVSGVVLSLTSVTMAHEGKPHHASDLPYTWGLDPLVILSLALSGWLYWRGVRRLWREAQTGRGIARWEAAAYAGGWFMLFVALVSPLHPMGEVLFSAHMTQHELLMLVAAPLLVMGRPLPYFLWGLPDSWRPAIPGAQEIGETPGRSTCTGCRSAITS